MKKEGTTGFGNADVTKQTTKSPRCIVIAGPNGAGKTTFAKEFLPKGVWFTFKRRPHCKDLAKRTAGRLVLQELDRLAQRKDFAFESTLSGLTYVQRSRI